MKTGFSLMEILHREKPVLITGEGFAVWFSQSLNHLEVNLKPRFFIKSGYYIVPNTSIVSIEMITLLQNLVLLIVCIATSCCDAQTNKGTNKGSTTYKRRRLISNSNVFVVY